MSVTFGFFSHTAKKNNSASFLYQIFLSVFQKAIIQTNISLYVRCNQEFPCFIILIFMKSVTFGFFFSYRLKNHLKSFVYQIFCYTLSKTMKHILSEYGRVADDFFYVLCKLDLFVHLDFVW